MGGGSAKGFWGLRVDAGSANVLGSLKDEGDRSSVLEVSSYQQWRCSRDSWKYG